MADDRINRKLPLEGQMFEYKSTVPPPKVLAREIAAFANARGGRIVLGVAENPEGALTIVGLPDNVSVQSRVEEALTLLKPHPLIDQHFEDINGKRVYVIDIKTDAAPIIVDNGLFYIRRGEENSLIDEDLIKSLVEANPSIKPNILRSLGSRESDAERAENVDEFTKVVRERIEEDNVNPDRMLSDAIERTRSNFLLQRKERYDKAHLTFIVAITALILGILLVYISIVLLVIGYLQAGIVTTISSTVSGIVSGLAFVFNKQTNDRVDENTREMNTLDKSYIAMQYISKIKDEKTSDEAIRDIIKKIVSD